MMHPPLVCVCSPHTVSILMMHPPLVCVCSPHTLYMSPGKTRPPSILRSSFAALDIEGVMFTCTESRTDNHTELFTPQACPHTLITRRGNTLVLQVLISSPVSAPYVVSLTFVPYHRPSERFAQFRARGVAKDSQELRLSVALPSNFPVGKYHTLVTVSVRGEILTHYSKQSIAVLFDPWNQGIRSILLCSNYETALPPL